MASDLMLFQIASITALIGMGLGWRGVMTRYSGFYDLPTAWSMMFWGILLGGVYGSIGDSSLLLPYLEGKFLPYLNLVICLILAVIVHLILRTKKVRRTGSQPTTGWALGLAVGGMVAMFVIFRLLQIYDLDLTLGSTILLVAIISPRAHALIFCRHGIWNAPRKEMGHSFENVFLGMFTNYFIIHCSKKSDNLDICDSSIAFSRKKCSQLGLGCCSKTS